MVWSIDRTRRRRPLNARRPQLVRLAEGDAKLLCYGADYFGGLKAFTFQCPGPCSTVHEVRPGQRRRLFDSKTQRFRCPDCGIELQLSILAEILPPPLSARDAAEYEASVIRDFEDRPPDTVPTVEQAAEIRRNHRVE